MVGLGRDGRRDRPALAIEAGYDDRRAARYAELGEKARDRIAHFLQRKVEKGQLTGGRATRRRSRGCTLTTELAELAECDLVIEAIVEELDAKRALFAELERSCRPDADPRHEHVGALGHRDRGRDLAPERVVGMHFFNPAPLMPLVEIVRAELSSDEAVEAAYASASGSGKKPIRCHDTPGFVVNRVLIPLLNDCVRVLDEARVTPEDLDTAMTPAPAGRWGRARSSTSSGSTSTSTRPRRSTRSSASRAWRRRRGSSRWERGYLGRKSGHGFYRYES